MLQQINNPTKNQNQTINKSITYSFQPKILGNAKKQESNTHREKRIIKRNINQVYLAIVFSRKLLKYYKYVKWCKENMLKGLKENTVLMNTKTENIKKEMETT